MSALPETLARTGDCVLVRSDEASQVQRVVALYVRATDARDGTGMSLLFVHDGRVEIFHRVVGVPMLLAELRGAQTIGQAVREMMPAHAPSGWSHHTTHDWIIDVDGDSATFDAQFVVFESLGTVEPACRWSTNAEGVQGLVKPTAAGYFRVALRKVGGTWKIVTMRIIHDLPIAIRRVSSAATRTAR